MGRRRSRRRHRAVLSTKTSQIFIMLCFSGLLLTGCTSAPGFAVQSETVSPLVRYTNLETPAENPAGTQTMLVVAQIEPAQLVEIAQPQKIPLTGPGKLEFETGDLFVRAQSPAYGTVFCSVRNINRSLLDYAVGRICIADADGDGLADRYYEIASLLPAGRNGFLYGKEKISPMPISASVIAANPVRLVKADPGKADKLGRLLALRYEKFKQSKKQALAKVSVVTSADNGTSWKKIATEQNFDFDMTDRNRAALDFGLVRMVVERKPGVAENDKNVQPRLGISAALKQDVGMLGLRQVEPPKPVTFYLAP